MAHLGETLHAAFVDVPISAVINTPLLLRTGRHD